MDIAHNVTKSGEAVRDMPKIEGEKWHDSFLDLPPEIRMMVYETLAASIVLEIDIVYCTDKVMLHDAKRARDSLALLETCKTIHIEAQQLILGGATYELTGSVGFHSSVLGSKGCRDVLSLAPVAKHLVFKKFVDNDGDMRLNHDLTCFRQVVRLIAASAPRTLGCYLGIRDREAFEKMSEEDKNDIAYYNELGLKVCLVIWDRLSYEGKVEFGGVWLEAGSPWEVVLSGYRLRERNRWEKMTGLNWDTVEGMSR